MIGGSLLDRRSCIGFIAGPFGPTCLILTPPFLPIVNYFVVVVGYFVNLKFKVVFV